MKISAIDQQKGCCKHIHRFFPQRILDESTLLPAPPEKTEGNRNQRWKTEINGEPFPAHPGANSVPSVLSVHSVLPSQSFASVPIPSALPLTKKKHRHLRTRDSEHFTEPSGSTSHLHAPAVLFTSSRLCRERFAARVLGVLRERGQRKGCSQGLFPGHPGAKNSQSSQ